MRRPTQLQARLSAVVVIALLAGLIGSPTAAATFGVTRENGTPVSVGEPIVLYVSTWWRPIFRLQFAPPDHSEFSCEGLNGLRLAGHVLATSKSSATISLTENTFVVTECSEKVAVKAAGFPWTLTLSAGGVATFSPMTIEVETQYGCCFVASAPKVRGSFPLKKKLQTLFVGLTLAELFAGGNAEDPLYFSTSMIFYDNGGFLHVHK